MEGILNSLLSKVAAKLSIILGGRDSNKTRACLINIFQKQPTTAAGKKILPKILTT